MNSWLPFITGEDQQFYSSHVMPAPAQWSPRKTALLCVDNNRDGQRSVDDGRRIFSEVSWAERQREMALENIHLVLKHARQFGLTVIHVTGLAGGESGLVPWYSKLRDTVPSAEQDVERYTIVEGFEPEKNEPLVRKAAPSAFFGTHLTTLLNQRGIDNLVVCGQATSGCVRATVVDAASYRYDVLLVQDAVYDRYESSHSISLFDMHQKYCRLTTAADIGRHFKAAPRTVEP